MIKSIVLQQRDKVICTTHTYISVRNVIDNWAKMYNADVVCLDIPGKIKAEDEVIFEYNHLELIL